MPNSNNDKPAAKPLRYNSSKENGGYTESQLNERVRGHVISQEFTFPNDILQNYREKSLQTGDLHGPECWVDGDINLYQRRKMVLFMQQREWKPGKVIEKPSDTSDSSDTKQNLKVVS